MKKEKLYLLWDTIKHCYQNNWQKLHNSNNGQTTVHHRGTTPTQLQSKYTMQVEKSNLKDVHNWLQNKLNKMNLLETLDKDTYLSLKTTDPH